MLITICIYICMNNICEYWIIYGLIYKRYGKDQERPGGQRYETNRAFYTTITFMVSISMVSQWVSEQMLFQVPLGLFCFLQRCKMHQWFLIATRTEREVDDARFFLCTCLSSCDVNMKHYIWQKTSWEGGRIHFIGKT